MLLVLALKEWATNLLELRFLVCASLCVCLGVLSVFVLREDLAAKRTEFYSNQSIYRAQAEEYGSYGSLQRSGIRVDRPPQNFQVLFYGVEKTLDRTAVGSLERGSRVNLERSMRADDRLDGHIVQGHVDGTGTVEAFERRGDDVRFVVSCGPEVIEFLVEKGSVSIDGVSLTVVSVQESSFDVALIPHTLEVTTLGEKQTGDRVNLEADVLGKYVKRYLDRITPCL